MNTRAAFDKWMEAQVQKGLVDLKVSVTRGRGITDTAVMGELLTTEAAIAAGFHGAAPKPVSDIPHHIRAVINQVQLQA